MQLHVLLFLIKLYPLMHKVKVIAPLITEILKNSYLDTLWARIVSLALSPKGEAPTKGSVCFTK